MRMGLFTDELGLSDRGVGLVLAIIVGVCVTPIVLAHLYHADVPSRAADAFELISERAAEPAKKYERASAVAVLYDRESDIWTSAAAHRQAALHAGDAADEWAPMIKRTGKGGDWDVEAAATYGRDARTEAIGWLRAEGAAWDSAAETAAVAGYTEAAAKWSGMAADARSRAAGMAIDMDIAGADRSVAEMMERLDVPGLP